METFSNLDRSPQTLAKGASLGTMTVVESGERRLVLKGSPGLAWLLILLGLGLTAWGAMSWRAYLDNTGERVSTKALSMPVIGVLAVVAGVVQLFTRVTVDGRELRVRRGGLLGRSTRNRHLFSKVVLKVLPKSMEHDETLRVELHPYEGKAVDVLGSVETKDGRAFCVANAGYEMARLLDLSLVVEGEATAAPQKLQSILQTIGTPVTVTKRRAA
jgi:hypothetical protein